MKALRIVGWSRFEKSDHKKCKNMTWVATPTSHDGIGFLKLLTSPDGLRRYGGWHLILQIAAKCPTHGLLVSDAGRPLGAAEIALKTRANESDINDAIQACCEIGWIESVDVTERTPESSGETPEDSCLQDRTGQDKTGQERTGARSAPPTPPGCNLLMAALKASNAAGAIVREREALDEWITLTINDIECRDDAESAEAVRWMIRQAKKDGVVARYARHVQDRIESCRIHMEHYRRDVKAGKIAS